MNQGRIWCVVHPTVGLPLLLGSVTGISLIVHASVMSNTTWMSRYWQGGPKANKTADNPAPSAAASALANAQPGFVISVAPVAPASGKTETSFLVTVAPNAPPTASATPRAAKPPSDKLAAAVPRTP